MAKQLKTKTEREIECLKTMGSFRAHGREGFKSAEDSVLHFLAQGDHLIEWKEILLHGEFQPFLEQNTDFTPRRAQKYMKASRQAAQIGKSALRALLSRDPTLDAVLTYDKPKGESTTPSNSQSGGEVTADPEPELITEPAAADNETEGYDDQEVEVIEVDVEEAMEIAAKAIEAFCRCVNTVWKTEMPDDPWLQHKGLADSAHGALRSALKTIRLAKCTDTCPHCDWDEKCKTCHGTGRIPKVELGML